MMTGSVLRFRCVLFAACYLVLGAAAAMAQTPDLRHFRLVFEEKFEKLDLRSAANPDGRWDTKFKYDGRTLPTNGEMELYVDPDYLGLGLNPFSVKDGVLTITALPTDANLKERLGGYPYVSGLLTTQHSFAQTYGYFEIRARLPPGKGLWPAFWLLPSDNQWPPEIDVFEVLGDDPRTVYMSIHSTVANVTTRPVKAPDTSQDFHDYAVMWGKDDIVWYFDGREQSRVHTPADMHRPMYLLINLAVGGRWPGQPNKGTVFPAEMKVAYVRAYATPETIPAMPQRPAVTEPH